VWSRGQRSRQALETAGLYRRTLRCQSLGHSVDWDSPAEVRHLTSPNNILYCPYRCIRSSSSSDDGPDKTFIVRGHRRQTFPRRFCNLIVAILVKMCSPPSSARKLHAKHCGVSVSAKNDREPFVQRRSTVGIKWGLYYFARGVTYQGLVIFNTHSSSFAIVVGFLFSLPSPLLHRVTVLRSSYPMLRYSPAPVSNIIDLLCRRQHGR